MTLGIKASGLVALGLAPLDVTGQSVQVREHGALVNLVPEQRVFQGFPMCIGYSYPNNFAIRLELQRRSGVRREDTTLRP